MPPPACRMVTFADPTPPTETALGAADPQRVDHQLQVTVQDDLAAALDAFLRHVAEVLRHVLGSVIVTVRPGPITGVAAAEKLRRQAAEQLPPPLVTPKAAAVRRQARRPPHRVGPSPSWWWLRRTARCRPAPAGRPARRARWLAPARRRTRRPSRPRGRPAPALIQVATRFWARAVAAFRRRRGIAGVEVVGQQRAQQRRHRDQRQCARPVRLASGLGVVPTECPTVVGCRRPSGSGINHASAPSAFVASPCPPGGGTARPTTDTAPGPRSETPSRTPE